MSPSDPPVSGSQWPGVGAEVPSPFIPLWALGIELGASCLHVKHVSKGTKSSANFPSLNDVIRLLRWLRVTCRGDMHAFMFLSKVLRTFKMDRKYIYILKKTLTNANKK